MKPARREFTQLRIEERELMKELLADGCSLREIGRQLGRPHTTISRELQKRSSPVTQRYTPRLAQEQVHAMAVKRGKRERLKDPFIREYVEEKLRELWSPEQISGRLSLDHPGYAVSSEAIYLYIYARCQREGWGIAVQGEDLRIYLRRKHRRRNRKKVPFTVEKGPVRNRLSIEKRPKYIEKRKQLGHWEGDSMVSQKSKTALNTLVERGSGVVKISKLNNLTGEETKRVVKARLLPLPRSARRTLTTDNGRENSQHEAVTKDMELPWYFCHTYASHERGSNENTNGLIRQYFPKCTDFATVSEETIVFVEDQLNNRPRKRYQYLTPNEVFNRKVVR